MTQETIHRRKFRHAFTLIELPAVRKRKANGFTLIELLVVIGILIVLAGIAFVAFRKMMGGSQIDQTRTTLGNLQNMLVELDTNTHLSSASIPIWLYHAATGNRTDTVTAFPPPSSLGVAADFWRAPAGYMAAVGGAPSVPYPLIAPGVVIDGSGSSDRDVSVAVVNTSIVMTQLVRMPNNRAGLDQFQTSLTYLPIWTSSAPSGPGSDRIIGSASDAPDFEADYAAGVSVKYIDPSTQKAATFRAVKLTGAINSTPPGTDWVLDTRPTPLLLDAWSNPIIFVPASGLQVELKGDLSDYDPTATTETAPSLPHNLTKIVTSVGLIDPGQAVPPGARPFFASAGPDGNFWKGDDNVYSFTK